MKVRELMTAEVWSCRPPDTLNDVARTMWDEDVGSVPVVDTKRHVVGFVTDRDVAMACYLQGKLLSEIHVVDVMSRQVVACGAEDTVEFAERTMDSHHLRRLPVIDDDGRLVGLISRTDLARLAA
jgi:CBS domain-containing protein